MLGILPGIVGVLQATEAIKLLLGRGDPLAGRLLTYDRLKMKFRELASAATATAPCAAPSPPSRVHRLRGLLRLG